MSAAPAFTSLREKIAFETAARKARYAKFQTDWSDAVEAGNRAALAIRQSITPMVIVGADADGNQSKWIVPDGPCGFAYLTVHPATCSFARWLVKEGLARKSYYGGVEHSIQEHNQSMGMKAAHAEAMAKLLTERGHAGVSFREVID